MTIIPQVSSQEPTLVWHSGLGRKRAMKTRAGSNVTLTMYAPVQGSFSMPVERKAVLHEGVFHIAVPTVMYPPLQILKKSHFKDPY